MIKKDSEKKFEAINLHELASVFGKLGQNEPQGNPPNEPTDPSPILYFEIT